MDKNADIMDVLDDTKDTLKDLKNQKLWRSKKWLLSSI
jgi:hypothetical protein